MPKIRLKKRRISFDEALTELHQEVLKTIKAQTSRGYSAEGQLPKYKDKKGRIKLRDTGLLMSSAYADAKGVHFPVSYASYVNDKYNFVGINQRYMARFMKVAAKIIGKVIK